MKVINKPVEAVQWYADSKEFSEFLAKNVRPAEGVLPQKGPCPKGGCSFDLSVHSFLTNGGFVLDSLVCPGDWIVEGESRPLSPEEFAAAYQEVGSAPEIYESIIRHMALLVLEALSDGGIPDEDRAEVSALAIVAIEMAEQSKRDREGE